MYLSHLRKPMKFLTPLCSEQPIYATLSSHRNGLNSPHTRVHHWSTSLCSSFGVQQLRNLIWVYSFFIIQSKLTTMTQFPAEVYSSVTPLLEMDFLNRRSMLFEFFYYDQISDTEVVVYEGSPVGLKNFSNDQ